MDNVALKLEEGEELIALLTIATVALLVEFEVGISCKRKSLWL
jgi:hypothetical protein